MKARCGLFALSLVSLAAFAADAPRYSFACDAAAGDYLDWKRTVSTRRIEIAGRLLVSDLYEHKKWKPAGGVFLRRRSDHAVAFGIRFFAESHAAKTLTIELLKVGGRDEIGTIARSSKWVPFTLTLQPDGQLTATAGDAKGSINVGEFKPETFELGCSSGTFEFANVTVQEKD